jgi:hypothetical protein
MTPYVTGQAGHGIRLSVSGTGNQLALWCACQRRDNPRAPWLARPVDVRPSWTVPEALVALHRWHDRGGR